MIKDLKNNFSFATLVIFNKLFDIKLKKKRELKLLKFFNVNFETYFKIKIPVSFKVEFNTFNPFQVL